MRLDKILRGFLSPQGKEELTVSVQLPNLPPWKMSFVEIHAFGSSTNLISFRLSRHSHSFFLFVGLVFKTILMTLIVVSQFDHIHLGEWYTKLKKTVQVFIMLSKLEGLLLLTCPSMIFYSFAVTWDCWLVLNSNPFKPVQCWFLYYLLLISLFYWKCFKITSLFHYFFKNWCWAGASVVLWHSFLPF